MPRYTIYRDKDRIDVFGYDQSFDEEDIKSLWDDHKILYQRGGVMAVWIQERKGSAPLVHLMQEDDGHTFWSVERNVCFDAGWLDNYIEILTDLKNTMTAQEDKAPDKIIAREVSPEARDFSTYFDDDGFNESGGENCTLYIIQDEGWGRLSGFHIKEYKALQAEMEAINEEKDKEVYEIKDIWFVSMYLRRKTKVKWKTKAFAGYSQGDYCTVLYCPDHYSDDAINEIGHLWLGCGTEFDIDDCGGYFLIDEVRWKEGAPLRKALADLYGCKPEELEVQLYTGEHKISDYKVMEDK